MWPESFGKNDWFAWFVVIGFATMPFNIIGILMFFQWLGNRT